MSILVIGSSGQLATHLREFLPDAIYLGRPTFDLSEPAALGKKIEAVRPTAIVNAAGYTAVDKAESERDVAWRVNAESVASIARAAGVLGVPLVHVSTDYVFDGLKPTEYEEQDAPHPINVYGATKLAGEIAARTLCPKVWILRVSWVFSEHGSNFIKTILRLAAHRDSVSVVSDQRGRPTYARDAARVIAGLVDARGISPRVPFGTYHAVGGPVVSWHEFAKDITRGAFERGKLDRLVTVRPIPTPEYAAAAKRPSNSALKPSVALKTVAGAEMDWRDGLNRVLDRL